MHIPFLRSTLGEEEARAARDVILTGKVVGDGARCRGVEKRLREMLSCPHALLTTSCTHAMELGLMALGLKPGDEVIMPSFAFVSAPNAVLRAGGTPVFADIEPSFLNISPQAVEEALTPRTRGILPIQYAGAPCEMDALKRIAAARGLFILEDAAQALGSSYKGKPLGTVGDAGCFSFHGTKNITCGEGGALVTSREDIARKAEIVREKGTDRSSFLRGEVDKYTWQAEGSSFVLSDILAAVLDVQLTRMPDLQARRRHLGLRYLSLLRPLAEEGLLAIPPFDSLGEGFNWHIFHVRVRESRRRDEVIRSMKEAGIDVTFHFVPLHSSPFAQAHLPSAARPLPLTDEASETLVRLPLYPDLSDEEQDRVAETFSGILRRMART